MKAKLLVATMAAICAVWAGVASVGRAGGPATTETATECCGNQGAPEAEAGAVYGNCGRWEYSWGRLWFVMDYDHRYPNGGDIRRRCGQTGIHYISYDAIKSIHLKGYCLLTPGHPAWYKVVLVGNDLTASSRLTADVKMAAFEKVEELKDPVQVDVPKSVPPK